mgnify:FL=1
MAQTPIVIGFPGNPAADTVYTAFTTVNANAVIVDAEQVAQDVIISASAASIVTIDAQITGLGVGLNDVNAALNIAEADIAANTVLINANLNMTYSIGSISAPITNIPTTFRTLITLVDGSVVAGKNYEYKLSTVVGSDQSGQSYSIRYRIDAGTWTTLKLRTDLANTSQLTTLWIGHQPLTSSTTFDVEISKDASSLGNMTALTAQVAIVQMD